MSPSDRDRRDLASVIEALLTGSQRGGATAASVSEAETALSPHTGGGPRFEVVGAVACGAEASAPLFLLALAALPTAAPQTVALSARDGEAAWIGPLADASERLSALEREGGRVIVLLPPADSREVRALALAASSHLLWLDSSSSSALDEAQAFLEALHFGADGARLGWLTAPDVSRAPVERSLARWCEQGPRRSTTPLGSWRPGQPLPTSVCGFLAAVSSPAPGPLTWALSLLK